MFVKYALLIDNLVFYIRFWIDTIITVEFHDNVNEISKRFIQHTREICS